MSTAIATKTAAPHTQLPGDWSLADLQKHLGGIPLERIRLFPPPGYATEDDVSEIEAREDRLYELENGILVEKAMGWYESMIGVLISSAITSFLESHDLGKVFGADGTLKLLPGTIKIPDVSFISWQRWPKQRLPRRPIPALVPDLAVEVLSETNTPEEMDDKLQKYFQAGVRLIWYVDPDSRTARSYTSATDVVEIDENGALDGGDVLPAFQLPLRQLFDEADRQGPRDD